MLRLMKPCDCHAPFPGHSKVHSILVGTNQGSVLGYTVDMPSGRHRDTRSPIVMPVGEYIGTHTWLTIYWPHISLHFTHTHTHTHRHTTCTHTHPHTHAPTHTHTHTHTHTQSVSSMPRGTSQSYLLVWWTNRTTSWTSTTRAATTAAPRAPSTW